MALILRESMGDVKYDKKLLKESLEDHDAPLIFEDCVLQRADKENQNHRIYPKNIMEKEIENYKVLVRERRSYGTCDHPDSQIVCLKDSCWYVTEIWWNGLEVRGNLRVLRHTEAGKIIEGIVRDEGTIGISSRALGEVEKDSSGKIDIVQKGMILVSFDAVAEPSTKNAFLNSPQKMNESVEKYLLRNENFNREDLLLRYLNNLYCGKDKCDI